MQGVIDRKITFNQKEYFQKLNQHAINQFKKSDATQLTIFPVSKFPWKIWGAEPEIYTKRIIEIGRGRIFIIAKNGIPISYVWETTPKKLQAAVMSGIYQPEALSAKVISEMGKYKPIGWLRIYEKGLVSTHYLAKNELLTYFQERLKRFQPLERLINSQNSITNINAVYLDCIRDIQQFQKQIKCDYLKKYDIHIAEKLKNFLDDDIRQLEKLKNKLSENNLKSHLSAFGKNSLMYKLQKRMIKMIKQTQGLNQNITYARTGYFPESFDRGEFNSVCETALSVINQHEVDLHNVVLPEHQGDFLKEKKKKHYIEFIASDKNAIAAICQIEKSDSIFNKGEKFYFRKENDEPFDPEPIPVALKATAFVKWSMGHSTIVNNDPVRIKILGYFKTTGILIFNILSGAFFMPVDIVLGLVDGLFDFNFSLVQETRIVEPAKTMDSHYNDLFIQLNNVPRPLGFHIGFSVGTTLYSVMLSLIDGMVILAKHVKKIPEYIKDDRYIAQRVRDKNIHLQNILDQMDVDVVRIQAEAERYQNAHETYGKKHKKKDDVKKNRDHDRQFALPPYHLSSGEWEDGLSKLPKGLMILTDAILQPMHANSPMKGLLYTLLFISSGLAILAPHNSFLPKFYQDFTQWLGEQLATSQKNKALSVPFIEGQAAIMLTDLLQDGSRSLLGKFVNEANGDLLDIGSLLVCGYFIGICLEKMPAISGVIKQDLGSTVGVTVTNYGSTLPQWNRLCEANKNADVSDALLIDMRKKVMGLSKWIQELESKNDQEIEQFLQASGERQLSGMELKKILEQGQFLRHFINHFEVLAYLPSRTKRELMHVAYRLFQDKKEILSAIENSLYPDQSYSIIARSFQIAANYVVNIARVLAFPYTGNLEEPMRDLLKHGAKDLTRLLRSVHGCFGVVVNVLYALFYTPFRALGDAACNGVGARTEGFIRGNTHKISDATATIAARFSGSYCKMKEKLNTPFSGVYQQVTSADPGDVIRKAVWQIPPKVNNVSRLGPPSGLRPPSP